jgi:hypothetical protein
MSEEPINFASSGQPLAGGLALMQPDAGTLIAFNAAPGTVGPEGTGAYGAFATALAEMVKAGGLPLESRGTTDAFRILSDLEVPILISRSAPTRGPPRSADRSDRSPSRRVVRPGQGSPACGCGVHDGKMH